MTGAANGRAGGVRSAGRAWPRRTKLPPAPADFAPAAVALWRALWRDQAQLADGDALTVERLCRLEGEAAALRDCLQRDGPVLRRPLQNSRGQVLGEESYPHPSLTPLRKIGAEAAALCAALGLTPLSRRALGLDVLTGPGEPDELDLLKAKYQRRREAEKRPKVKTQK